ncbi:MAG: restriction endonuclease subunit S [PVC group bacterium]|nr:restriction endonuclease subunit S [PVC group bacterium]
MKSNYNRIGEYIRLVDERNTSQNITLLLGLTISKEFIPSVANIVGADMARYKIIRKNQFACSLMQVRRDKKMPVALLRDYDEAIISQAYPVFEIDDTQKLLPEYLMMWMSRAEFDREACFYAVGGVRGSLEWKDFCSMELPVPKIETQKKIVKEYNTIVYRINLNDRLNQKLEETARSIYKQWFEDFEFPDENGKPYKSNGGEMVYNEDLDMEIPKEFRDGFINDIVDVIDGDRGVNYPGQNEYSIEDYCLFLNAGNVTNTGFAFLNTSFISKEKDRVLRKGKLNRNDVAFTTRGTVGNIAYYGKHIEYEHIRINSGMIILRGKKYKMAPLYVYFMMNNDVMKMSIKNYLSGSAQPQLPIKDLVTISILIPSRTILEHFVNIIINLQNHIDLTNKQNRNLYKLLGVNLSKLSSGYHYRSEA